MALALHKAAGTDTVCAAAAGWSGDWLRSTFRRVALFSYAANPLICFQRADLRTQ